MKWLMVLVMCLVVVSSAVALNTSGLLGVYDFNNNLSSQDGNTQIHLQDGVFRSYDDYDYTDDIISYYSFDDDLNDHDNTNTVSLDTSVSRGSNGGFIGNGLTFAGGTSTNRAVMPIDAQVLNDDSTINLWVDGSNYASGSSSLYVPVGVNSSTNFRVYIRNSDNLFSTTYGGTNYQTNDALINNQDWYMLTLTRDGDDLHRYVNGEFVDTVEITTSIPSGYHITLGSQGITSTWAFNGKIDEVGVWDKYMQPFEIQNLYNAYIDTNQYPFTTYDAPEPTVGYRGHGLTFYGDSSVNEAVSEFDATYLNSDSTINVWINSSNISSSTSSVYHIIETDPGLQFRHYIRNSDNRNILSYGYDNNYPQDIEEVNQQTWYMLTLVRDGDTVSQYVNGSKVGNYATITTTIPSGYNISLGGNAHLFTGYMDELSLWSRPLNDTEIQSLYTTYENDTDPFAEPVIPNNPPVIESLQWEEESTCLANEDIYFNYSMSDADLETLTFTYVYQNSTDSVTWENYSGVFEVTHTYPGYDDTVFRISASENSAIDDMYYRVHAILNDSEDSVSDTTDALYIEAPPAPVVENYTQTDAFCNVSGSIDFDVCRIASVNISVNGSIWVTDLNWSSDFPYSLAALDRYGTYNITLDVWDEYGVTQINRTYNVSAYTDYIGLNVTPTSGYSPLEVFLNVSCPDTLNCSLWWDDNNYSYPQTRTFLEGTYIIIANSSGNGCYEPDATIQELDVNINPDAMNVTSNGTSIYITVNTDRDRNNTVAYGECPATTSGFIPLAFAGAFGVVLLVLAFILKQNYIGSAFMMAFAGVAFMVQGWGLAGCNILIGAIPMLVGIVLFLIGALGLVFVTTSSGDNDFE